MQTRVGTFLFWKSSHNGHKGNVTRLGEHLPCPKRRDSGRMRYCESGGVITEVSAIGPLLQFTPDPSIPKPKLVSNATLRKS